MQTVAVLQILKLPAQQIYLALFQDLATNSVKGYVWFSNNFSLFQLKCLKKTLMIETAVTLKRNPLEIYVNSKGYQKSFPSQKCNEILTNCPI